MHSFEVCAKISQDLKQKTTFFHVYDDQNGQNVLFITSDDYVYTCGQNSNGCSGLGHNQIVNEPKIISELCNKNITQFFIGYNFVLALNRDGKVFGWGANDFGQLGRGTKNHQFHYFKPEMIFFPDDEIICQLSCGTFHSLALTTYGSVYGWGYNKYGQIGFGQAREDEYLSPIELTNLEDYVIKSIHCSVQRSYALTCEGQVFCWGQNSWCALGLKIERDESVFEPKLIDIPIVKNVCPSAQNTYFLTKEGLVYFSGKSEDNGIESFQIIPRLLIESTEFETLNSIPTYHKLDNFVTGQSDGSVYSIKYNAIEKTDYQNISDFYSYEHQMSFNTISFETGISVQFSENQNNIIERKISENSMKFFNQVEVLGEGAFGKVTKVKSRFDRQFYALKRIRGMFIQNKHLKKSIRRR